MEGAENIISGRRKSKTELLQEVEALRRHVSKLEQAEQTLKNLEKQFKELFENIPVGIYRVTPNGRITMANQTFIRMLGYSSFEELLQPDLEKEGFATGHLHSAFKDLIEKDENVVEREFEWIRRDGAALFVIKNSRAIRDESGKILYHEGIVQDITESKQREKELNVNSEKMVRVEQLKFLETLLSALSNKLTQPLTVARLSIENSLAELNAVSYSGEAVEELNAGLRGISNITSAVKQFGMFAKETSKNKAKRVVLKTVAERILQFLEERAWRAGITMLLQKMDRLPPIYSYEKDLEQLFFSLVENAIEATNGEKDRQLTISGAVKDENIELKFSDNCGGMAPEILDRIFEPFFTTKATGKATGLGLCTVQHIVSKTGGNIRVENKPGEGSTFIVMLPIRSNDKYQQVKNDG
jgi:PAS domain S-box-containing protein